MMQKGSKKRHKHATPTPPRAHDIPCYAELYPFPSGLHPNTRIPIDLGFLLSTTLAAKLQSNCHVEPGVDPTIFPDRRPGGASDSWDSKNISDSVHTLEYSS